MRQSRTTCRERGIALVEALVYIAVLTILLSLISIAIWKVMTSQTRLAERSDRLMRILNAGERWRESVRRSESHPTPVDGAEGITTTALGLPQRYERRGDRIILVAGDSEDVLVRDVVQSRMERHDRRGVVFWQWDVTLKLNQQGGKTQTFTFMAVPEKQPSPL